MREELAAVELVAQQLHDRDPFSDLQLQPLPDSDSQSTSRSLSSARHRDVLQRAYVIRAL